jgi:CBS domain containing-hemolysin-like protein
VFGNSFDGPVGQVQVVVDVVVVVWFDLVAVSFDESFVLFVHLIATFFKVVLSPIVCFINYTLSLFVGLLFFRQPLPFSHVAARVLFSVFWAFLCGARSDVRKC